MGECHSRLGWKPSRVFFEHAEAALAFGRARRMSVHDITSYDCLPGRPRSPLRLQEQALPVLDTGRQAGLGVLRRPRFNSVNRLPRSAPDGDCASTGYARRS